MKEKGRKPKNICRVCWDYGEEYGKLKCGANLDYCPFTRRDKKREKPITPAELIGKIK